MVRLFLLFFIALLTTPVNAQDKELVRAVDFSTMGKVQLATVNTVIDALTMQLKDGRIIRLSGIEVPDMQVNDSGPYAQLAVEILRDMLVEKSVTLYQTPNNDSGRFNRMGHHLAQVVLDDGDLWVQGTLLSLGVARVRTTADNPDMAQALYEAESTAREQKAGIWGDDAYPVLSPETAADHLRSVQVVEGRVMKVALNKNRIYINFGADWRTDFTASIAPADKRRFSKVGLDPLQWSGKLIRVRRWIDSYNGPYVDITHPEAVEFIIEGE